MAVEQLSVQQFRNFSEASFRPHPEINVITGSNGSGKTSILEAVYLLGSGRSFRAAHREALIRAGQDDFLVFSRLRDHDGQRHQIGWGQRRNGEFQVKVDGAECRVLAELARLLPVQIVDHQAHRIVEEGAEERRRFLDWGVFHVEHGFEQSWRRYRKALKQRNAALRDGLPEAQVRSWDGELAEEGVKVGAARERHVEQVQPLFTALLDLLAFPCADEVTLRHVSGWNSELSLGDYLSDAYQRDAQLGYTFGGPHRADLRILAGGRALRDVISRGQQKLLTYALKLAQCDLVFGQTRRPSVVLLDDLPAELDPENRGRLFRALARGRHQVFVTATEADLVLPWLPPELTGMTLFHVEQGLIKEVV